jgi:hypothetical protein
MPLYINLYNIKTQLKAYLSHVDLYNLPTQPPKNAIDSNMSQLISLGHILK